MLTFIDPSPFGRIVVAKAETLGIPIAPADQYSYEMILQQARCALGSETFGVRWAEGGALTWAQPVEEVLRAAGAVNRSRGKSPSPGR